MRGNFPIMACFRSWHLFISIKDFSSTKNHPVYFNMTFAYHFEMIVIILRTKERIKSQGYIYEDLWQYM